MPHLILIMPAHLYQHNQDLTIRLTAKEFWLKQTPTSYLSDEIVVHVKLINNLPYIAGWESDWFIFPEQHLSHQFSWHHHNSQQQLWCQQWDGPWLCDHKTKPSLSGDTSFKFYRNYHKYDLKLICYFFHPLGHLPLGMIQCYFVNHQDEHIMIFRLYHACNFYRSSQKSIGTPLLLVLLCSCFIFLF